MYIYIYTYVYIYIYIYIYDVDVCKPSYKATHQSWGARMGPAVLHEKMR